MKAQSGCSTLSLTLALDWGGVNGTSLPLYPRVRNPVPTVPEAGWAPGPVWMGAQNLGTTAIRSPDRPARNKTLHRLRYPCPHISLYMTATYGRISTTQNDATTQITKICCEGGRAKEMPQVRVQ